ncbi:hypothetical protein MMC24_004190 [Lignoscripta atroalba]|nr:hypothetical protein [Lignoscripta atroalba]
MAVRGQRFHLDLDTDGEDDDSRHAASSSSSALDLGFIRDISERSTTTAQVPSPPKANASKTGFPAHKKRNRSSEFKRQREEGLFQRHGSSQPSIPKSTSASHSVVPSASRGQQDIDPKSGTGLGGAVDDTEKERIDEENRERIAHMSPVDIEQERQELMTRLSPSLIERLLRRANIDEGRTDTGTTPQSENKAWSTPTGTSESTVPAKMSSKRVTFETPEKSTHPTVDTESPDQASSGPDAPPMVRPPDLHPAASEVPLPLPPQIHFPHPPATPSLDPSDPNFLENLHSKYFPHLPADPSKLAWMAPIPTEDSPADKDSPYNPSQDSLPPSAIRFDFRGRLIPPRLARQIPSTKGLHHHGMAPEAAGYTVPELAHLSRSAVPAQRCIAYQTLGRILYRLGRGDFGGEGEELYLGLWKCVEEGRVIETLVLEAGRDDDRGNRSCKITATEAVWLWRKGGGKRWKAQ